MNIDPTTVNTIMLVLDREQVAGVIHDLSEAHKRGAKSVMLLTTLDHGEEMEKVMTEFEQGQGSLDDLPSPDLIISSAIWTVGTRAEAADIIALVAEHSDHIMKKEDDNGR